MLFKHRHILGTRQLSADDITLILDTAEQFREINLREIKKVPVLRGKTVINLFYEASTRTRTSFEIAEKRLSADAINITASASSVVKGETLADTARNLEAMRPDVIVVRHAASGAAEYLAGKLSGCAIINAGDGAHEHPSQALLDALTIRRHKGHVAGLEVAIIGDIAHSRVVRSNLYALTALGARVRLCGPGTMMPSAMERLGARLCCRMEEALEGADVVMMLRIQRERQGRTLLPSLREYSRFYGLDNEKLQLAKADALVMHPGPMNRGVEISSEVGDGAQSVILDQVENGVAVRMALLYLVGAPAQNEEG